MDLVETFVRNPVKVTVGVILVMLFGAIALLRMPMQLTPEVEIPTITVETRWLGASPAEVESEIIQEQEEQLQSVEGLTKMTSESMDSMGRVTLEFAVGSDLGEALVMVSTRLQQVPEYPEDADEPVIATSNTSTQFIAWFILNEKTPSDETIEEFAAAHPELAEQLAQIRSATNAGLRLLRLREAAQAHPAIAELLPPETDVTTLRKFCEDFIETRFERVDGVSNSTVVGGREEELQVLVDPLELAARHLTIDDVRRELRTHNTDVSGGDFWEEKRRYVVRTLGRLRTVEQVENLILARRDDAPVYVRDVAEVRLGYKKPDGLVRRFGTSVIAINAQRKTGANVLDVMEGLRQAMDDLNRELLGPRGLELTQVYDETEYIYSAVALVTDNVIEGGVLSFIALLVFLRSFRSSVVIFLSIATSVIGMFLLLGLLGRSLNVLSLAGIAFAVGMLVDNFIVVLENIFRHRQEGDTIMAATIRGTQEVWGAIIASSLANLAVFVPVLFIEDQVGQLFRDLALAVSCALGLSLLVSLIVVPTAASRLLGQSSMASEFELPVGEPASEHTEHEGNGAVAPDPTRRRRRGLLASMGDLVHRVLHTVLAPLDWFGNAFVRFVVGINALLQRSLLLRLLTVVVLMGGSIVLSYLLMPQVEYLPNGNRNLVIGIMLPPPGYNIDKMQAMGAEIEKVLRPYWDVDPGSPEAAQLTAPVIGDFFYVARGRQLFMGVRAEDPLRAGELVDVLRGVTAGLPGVFMVAKQSSLFERGLTEGRTVDIEITGPELTTLVALGQQLMGDPRGNVMTAVPGAQAIPIPSLDLSNPEVHVVPRWEQAADMGLSAESLGYAVNALVDGAFATDYFVGGDKIDLSIVGLERYAARTDDLRGLAINTPSGQVVPLNAVADIALNSGPEQINRRQRQRAITIQVTPPPEVPLEAAMTSIGQLIAPLKQDPALAGLYQVNLSGTADKLRATWTSLRWSLLLATLITYLVMAALFESWLYPLIIILSVPLGAVGGFLGLKLLNLYVLQPLDMLTMVGFIILVGTVVNNPILIVEQALVHMREEQMSEQQAILESVRTRIRPIFMTALIGLFGLLPLVISPGAGSELYRGLGSVLLGGLVVSTIFTLILVPTLFSLVFEVKHRMVHLVRRQRHHPAAPQHDEPRERVIAVDEAAPTTGNGAGHATSPSAAPMH